MNKFSSFWLLHVVLESGFLLNFAFFVFFVFFWGFGFDVPFFLKFRWSCCGYREIEGGWGGGSSGKEASYQADKIKPESRLGKASFPVFSGGFYV